MTTPTPQAEAQAARSTTAETGAGAPARGSLGEVAAVFLKLGCIAFGGPAAHIAMMREELVRRRRWLDDASFLDLLGATNLIPGPNSTELAIHLGFRRAGWPGLIVAGALFIAPAMLLVLAIAWAYGAYSRLPTAQWLLYGIKPVIIAVVLQALYGLARTALTGPGKGPLPAVIAVAALVLYLLGFNELLLLFGGGLLVWLAGLIGRRPPAREAGTAAGGRQAPAVTAVPAEAAQPLAQAAAGLGVPGVAVAAGATATAAVPFSLVTLFLTFLKIGAVLYGSGYVLLAFLRGDFVERLGWLTDQQLLDAVSVGQFTPGPVFTTATFVGYLVGSAGGSDVWGGVVAALLATLGIFLPSFVFVALSGPLVPHLRRWTATALLLDGVNAAALGLMGAITITLGRAAVVDPLTAGLAVAALVLLVRWKVNSAWLVLGGALAGVVLHLPRG
ncbi:MAG TPA: chromate efflux transporter [Chloroflexota bacterium]|nr:chromate efflux transporter [Chloroflexota bacterium]